MIIERKVWQRRISVFIISLVAASAWAGSNIVISGSETLLVLNERWASAFMRNTPGVRIDVSGGGSSVGFSDLTEGRATIAAASRPMKDSEVAAFTNKYGCYPGRVAVALDGLAIYVHEINPILRLSREQLAGIFTGKISNWKDVGGPDNKILPYTRDKQSGSRDFIVEHLLEGQPFAASAQEVPTMERMHYAISTDTRAIGYGGIGYSERTRVLSIVTTGANEGIWPTSENVSSARYPLTRPLFYYINPSLSTPHLLDFIRWVLRLEGQMIARDVGYFPIQDYSVSLLDKHDRVVLTPANTRTNGFEIVVTLSRAGSDGDMDAWLTDQVDVHVGFLPDGKGAAKVCSAALFVRDTMTVPLEMQRDAVSNTLTEIAFTIRRELIDQSSVMLGQVIEGDGRKCYQLPLKEFVRQP